MGFFLDTLLFEHVINSRERLHVALRKPPAKGAA